MNLRDAVERTYAEGTAAMRRGEQEGEVRFDGPQYRLLRNGRPTLLFDGDVWMEDEDDDWARWEIPESPHRGDGFRTLDVVAALVQVEQRSPQQYAGRPGHRKPIPRPDPRRGPVLVDLDDAGRVVRVAWPTEYGEHVVEFWDFGRPVEIEPPAEYYWMRWVGPPHRPTQFAGRNSPMRRRRRRARRRA